MKDTHVNEFNGTFTDWRLNLWGESRDPLIQQLHPLPDVHDDEHETETVSVITTSISHTRPVPSPVQTTDHPDRPINAKPTDSTSISVSPSSSTTAQPSSTTEPEEKPTHTVSDSFLPGFFPTFGVSKRTQIWIYGSIGLIVIFCAGLGAYFVIQRRKRLRNNPRDDYEFEIVQGEDADEAKQGLTGRNRNRRGGELYDAFAGESDEDIFGSDDDGESEDHYEDTPSTESGSGRGQERKR